MKKIERWIIPLQIVISISVAKIYCYGIQHPCQILRGFDNKWINQFINDKYTSIFIFHVHVHKYTVSIHMYTESVSGIYREM